MHALVGAVVVGGGGAVVDVAVTVFRTQRQQSSFFSFQDEIEIDDIDVGMEI